MQNQKLAHLVVASSWRLACLPSPPSRGSVVASSDGGGHRLGKAGTEEGQAARRQEPRRGELERRLRVERD